MGDHVVLGEVILIQDFSLPEQDESSPDEGLWRGELLVLRDIADVLAVHLFILIVQVPNHCVLVHGQLDKLLSTLFEVPVPRVVEIVVGGDHRVDAQPLLQVLREW